MHTGSITRWLRRFGAGAASAAMLWLLATPAASERPSFQSLGANPSPEEACRNLAQAKFKWTDPAVADAGRFDQMHSQLRGVYGGGRPEGEPAIRVLVSGGMGGEGLVGPESVVASKNADGAWQVSRVYRSFRPPPSPEFPAPPLWPEPSGAAERPGIIGPRDGERDAWFGQLPQAQGQRLDALLAAPCMSKEPAGMPLDLKLRGGGIEPCYPDSASWSIEISEGGRTRAFGRSCRLLGPVGAIVNLLQNANLPSVSDPVLRKDLYAVDPAPSFSKLHAFLAARLPGARYESPHLSGTVISYRRLGRCDGELAIQSSSGKEVIRREWDKVTSVELWPDQATVKIYLQEPPDKLTFGGTVAALKVEGAATWIQVLCSSKDSPE